MVDEARLRWALIVSVLLHALVLMSASVLRNVRLPMPALPPSIDVDLAQLPPPAPKPQAQPKPQAEAPPQPAPPPPILMPKQQIVTPPDAGIEKPPPDTSFLSDRDNVVEQQTVKRGEGPAPQPAAPEPEPEPEAEPAPEPPKAKPAPQPRAAAPPPRPAAKPREQTKVASLPKLDKLFPLPGEFAGNARTPAAEPKPREVARRNLLPGSRQAFAVSPGVSDFLPTIREGDITLLNTKAEKFAPFVRRVAARVFQHLEINLKRTARGLGNGGTGREFAAVEAIMSKKGELVSARLVERETNTQMTVYKQLLTAARPDVFFDANPPAGAEAADGNIHFLLLVDLMIQVGADPRTGGASTYYSGMASVGLDALPKDQ